MKKSILLFCLVLSACSSGLEWNNNRPKEADATLKNKKDSVLYDIDESMTSIIEEEVHLYGKFYSDRMAFHIVDDPEMKIEGASVEQVILYLLDDSLQRKKYILDTNISSRLISKYGGFKFKPLHTETKRLAIEEGVLGSSVGKRHINPSLKRYQLKWLVDDRLIIFQHSEDSLLIDNIYIEEMVEYRSIMKSIYNQLNRGR